MVVERCGGFEYSRVELGNVDVPIQPVVIESS
jgi:hypothetical protein